MEEYKKSFLSVVDAETNLEMLLNIEDVSYVLEGETNENELNVSIIGLRTGLEFIVAESFQRIKQLLGELL